MTAKQYSKALEKLGLTAYSAAPVLGILRRQSMRYQAGDAAIPEPVARLLVMLQRHGVPEEWRPTA